MFLNAPKIKTISTERCCVCNSKESTIYTYAYDYELQTCQNVWTLVKCNNCGCIRLDERPDDSCLGIIYPEYYYSYNMSEKMHPIALWGKSYLDSLKLKKVIKHKPNIESYLDIGCGDGKYLEFFERRGINKKKLYGLELSDDVVSILKDRGYMVFNERIEACSCIPEDSIDLATMFHVIEHVSRPDEVLRSTRKLLKKDGIFVIETPNTDSFDARLFKENYWGGYHIPRHWHLFNRKNLCKMLENNGFKIISTHYQTGHSFWMYSIHHLLKYNDRMPMPKFARLFDPVTSLIPLIIFTGFDKVRAYLGRKTSSVMIVAQKVE